MASGEDVNTSLTEGRNVPLDIDDVHMLLQVEQEQIQKRTFTNWINAQLSKHSLRVCVCQKSSPSRVENLFVDLRDGVRLLDLLEVMSGQRLKREKGRGLFQQRGNIETALNFLRSKSIKLVNINIPDVIEGKPSIILGLIWTIILHCHIEELANTLSYSSRHSSLESLSSLDSDSGAGTPLRGSPVPCRASPLHHRFRLSAKKALLLWVRDQCKKVGCSISIKDFKTSWRSGVAFLAILCSLRPDLVDLSLAQTRTNLQNLEHAFCIAEQELGIPRLLEPEDIDIRNPDEKSIMTYVAQFLQYSNDLPTPDDDLEGSPSQKAREMTNWLQRAYEQLQEAWDSTERAGYSERYQAFQTFVAWYCEQRRPVLPMLSAMKHSAKLSEEQCTLRKAWDKMEEKLKQCRVDLDVNMPTPLDTLGLWLQKMEVVLSEEDGDLHDHARAARDARDKHEQLKVLLTDMSCHLNTLHTFSNTDEDGCALLPQDKLDEVKRRFTNARVMAKYHGIRLEYREQWHIVYDLLGCLKAKLNTWKGPYSSQESVSCLLQDWQDTVERQGLISTLKAELNKLKETATMCTSKAALAEDSGRVNRQVKEAESEVTLNSEAAEAVKDTLGRVLLTWESYKDCLHLLQVWLGQQSQTQPSTTQTEEVSSDLSKWRSHHAQLNEAGTYLIDLTECSTSYALAEELSRLNMQWADFIKKTKFSVVSQAPSVTPGAQAPQILVQEAGFLLREPVEVNSGTLRSFRKRVQGMIKKMSELDLDSVTASPDCSEEMLQKLKQTLPEVRQSLSTAEQACECLQKGASLLEGRVAELSHWTTEALDVCEHLKEREQRRLHGPHPRAKGLISRGLQLEGQLVTEGQDIQALLESVQKSSSLPFLSASALQKRVKEAVRQSQEAVETLSRLGVKWQGNVNTDQSPPNVTAGAISQPEPQTKTFQQYQPHASPKGASQISPKPTAQPPLRTTSQQKKSPGPAKIPLHTPSHTHTQAKLLTQTGPPAQAQSNTPQSAVQQGQTQPKSFAPQTSLKQRGQTKTRNPPPAPGQQEVYARAQALARSRLEKAKQHLQGHIQGAITVFSSRAISEEQARRMQETLKMSTGLEEFLESVEGLRAFCSGTQLRDIELLSLSVRAQWEAACSAIKAFLPDLQSEVKQSQSANMAVLSYEVDTNTQSLTSDLDVKSNVQVVIRADSTETKQTPERTIIQTTSGEEDEPSPQEAQRRYNTARIVFQQQLQENRQRLDEQSPSVTTLSLHTQLQDLQALKHQTEALWFEFELQYSQCFQFMEDSCSLESDRAELIQQWRGQNICLQARMKSLEAAVGLIDASDIQISQISEQLNNLAQKPLDITGFSLTDPTSVHADIKLLNERIQREQAHLFESSCETDDPGVLKNETEVQSHLPIQHAVQCCKQRLDQLRERHKQTESALNVLEQFLSHLQQVDGELSTAVSSHSTSQALQVASVRQRLHRAGEEAAMLDNLLVEAGLKLALDGKPVSCQDMMSILAKRLEEAETRLISGKKEMEKGVQGREEDERRERAIARKRRALQFGIREVLTALEKQDLKESTLPALQHRLRFLTDMESKLAALHSELQSLQDASAQTSHSDSSIRQLETQWEETHRAVAESREQCVSLIELLKMFQSCRSHLGGIMQKAEQTISEQSSYMGKDNLQRLLTRVTGIKSELSDLGDGVEEFRGVCRQLQSQMRKISDCADAPFENEADALMDRWLDITERTDSYLDNLKIGLALWDKLLVLAGEIETWTTYKLKAFAQTCPFETELEVTAMQEELKAQEDSVERFHSRAAEIQELLQSREPPLELQVIESQLRKRMGEVKELFLETSEVFRDILAAKTQVAAKMAECLSSLQTIQDSLRALSASDRPQLLQKIQSLSVELQTQVEQADAVLQQVVLLASVAGPENLQGLAKDSTCLQECISTTRQLIEQKKELAETLSEPAQGRDTVPREFQEPQSNDPSLGKTKENQAPKATIKITRDRSRTQDPLHKKSEDFQAVHPPLKKTKELQCSPLKQNKDQEVRDPLLKKNNEQIRDPQLKQSEEVRSETVRFKKTNEFQSKDSTAEEGLVLQCQNPLLKETKEIQAQDPKLKAIHPLQTQPPCPPKAQDKGLEETPGPHQEDLLRETEDFQQLTQTVRDWVRVLQIKIDPLGTGTCGSLAQTEEKLQAALQAVLDEKMEGNSRLEELKVKGQRLLVRTGLEGKFRQEILHSLRDTAEQWNMLLQYADQQYRFMQGVVERASAYQLQRQQAQTRLEQLQSQVAELPVLFPWPGLTERQRAVEQARSLLERVQSLAPALSALHAQSKELTQLTKDPSWTDESLTKLENSASALVKQLNEVCCNLDQSVQGEKHCANQLQHCSNTMDSLQKRTQETAEHMCDLESKLQNLKALQQAIDQKGRDLQEVQALTAALLHTCTTEGQTTLSNNVQSLQKQRIALEMTLHKHLSCLENQRISRKSSEHAVEEALQALQQWSQAQQRESQSPPDTIHLIQVTLERGQKLHHTLQEALSHWKVLQGVAGQELMGTLERDSLKTLSDSASHLSDLAQCLKEDMANATQMKTVDGRPAVSIDSTQGNTVHLKESFITETEHMEAADAIQSEATDPEQAESTVREEEALMDSGKLSATCTIQANTRPQETADVQATKATEKEAVKLTATSVSLAEGPKSKSHIPTQLPGKKNVSAHVVAEMNTGKDEDDLDSVQCSQPMEMHGAKKDLHVRNKAARSKDSFAGAWEKESQMDQLSGTSQLRAVVDIITDIQPLLKTNDNTMMKGLPLGDAWYLEPLPTEAGAQLTRTVLRVLSCRYHPAQINPVLMTQQLQEAQCLRQLVMEQVSALSQHDASKYPSSTASQCLEGRWSAALLDASATVQIKEAQLQQVTQYQQETQTIRDTLQSLEIELETLNLDSLGSSALQCEKLQAFLKSMEQMRSLFGELYQISSQVTAHISETEGPVALIVQVHDLQERWRVLKRTADKALRHTSICTTEMSALVQEAKELQEKLQTMQKLITPSHSPQTPMDSQAVIKLTVATSDLVVANEYYQHLLRVSQVLKQGPLGKKELDDVEHVLQNVKSELDLSQEMLSVHTPDTSDQLPTEILKVMQDYLTWAEQTESKIGRRRKLALFPEEARHQVNEMKKLQSEISNRQSKFTCAVKEFREKIVGLSERDTSIMLSLESTLENLHRKIAENCSFAVAEMDVMLHVREKIWAQIAKATSWLMSHFEKEYNKDKVSELVNTAPDLKMQLQKHKATLKAADRQATVVETLLDEVKDVALGLSITEGCHLINRLIALQAEVTDVVSHERSVCWELEELLHIHETSVKERAAVRKSLQQISTEIERQRYPVTRESLSTIEPLRHMLMEHQCHVQEIQCCPESQRRELLNIIYDLQNKTRLLDLQAKQYEMYLSCRHRMENSRDVVKDMVPLVTNSSVDLAKRLRLCLALLAEFPLVKTLCQETADKLEVISQNFFPSQLSAERNKMHQTLQSLASWELTLGREIKNLERILVGHLSHPVDHTAMFHCFSRVRQELHHPVCLDPDDNAIDTELRKRWALRRTLESGLRILEACEDDTATESYRETIDLGKRTLQDCTKLTVISLLHAQEALSEYYWTVHGVARFLQQAESSLLNSSTNFKDCMKEKQHTQQSLGSLVEGFQAHMTEIWTRVPPLMCLSIPQTEQLHIQILSHLLVANATLEAQAQMKLDTLHRSIKEQDIHEKEHKEINQIFRNTESKLSAILSQKSTSSGDCTDLLQRAMGLQRELQTMSGRLEKLRESCPGQGCSVPVELTLDHLWRRWAMLLRRVSALKSRLTHREEEWRDITVKMERSSMTLDRLYSELSDQSVENKSMEELQNILTQTEHLLDGTDQESSFLASLQLSISRLQGVSSPQDLKTPTQICLEWRSLQSRCKSLREQGMIVRRATMAEIQERGHVLEELETVRQDIVNVLLLLQTQTESQHLQEVQMELDSQKARMQDILSRVRTRHAQLPPDIEKVQQEIIHSLQKALEQSDSLYRLSEQVREVTVGLGWVQTLLQQKNHSFHEAERNLKCAWDKLDLWHSRIAVLESQVQELAEEKPEKAHELMDELMEPLRLYQTVAQQAEQRTTLISKIPACLQEYEDVLKSSTCWLSEAESWLNTPGTYTSPKCLHSHANSFQVVLDEAKRIQTALEAFVPILEEISPVCDTASQEQQLHEALKHITHLQESIIEPLSQLQHAAAEMDAIETEVKAMEKNVSKIRAILSSMDTDTIYPEEHLQHRQVILENIQSMKRTIAEIENCRPGLGLPPEAEKTLTAFLRAEHLLQNIQDLQQLTEEQNSALRLLLGQTVEQRQQCVSPSGVTTEHSLALLFHVNTEQTSMATPNSEEGDEFEEEHEDCHSSSSETLTGSVSEAADSGANEFESVNEEVRPLPKDTGLVSKETGPVTQELKAVAKKAITATKDIRSETKETEALTKEHGSPTKDKSSITMGKETEPQMASTDHIEGSNDKVIVEDHTAPPAQGHNHQMFCPETSLEQSVTTISAPTLVFSPLDTDIVLQKDTALEVQSELKEQRDLIKAIAHHGSSSDLEQEEHSSSHSPSGFYSATLRFPNLPKEGTTTRETWTKLLTRLEKLQEMIQSEQHKAPFGVSGIDKQYSKLHFLLDMHRHVEQLQHVCLKAGCKGTQVIMQERSHADLSEELCEVLSKITHSLDMVTHIFPTLSDMSREENQLLLLNLECLLAELVAVSSELQTLESVVAQDLGSETPKASACLKCLQNCLSTVQIGLSSRWDELSKHLGQTAQLQTRMQLLESPISVLNESGDENQSFIRNLPKLWGALEQCVELQSSSKSLCWGLVGLLELGSERLRKSPMAEVNSRAQLHTVLSGHKRYFKRLAKHFAMVQDLSQQLPEGVLQQLIDIEKQLSDIQKEAVEQGTQMQLNLQEWSEVEDVCGKLTRCLDEVEMGIPNETWEREPESQTKDRLKTCQKLKEVLQETRLQVGVLLDRGRVLQDRGCCCRGHGPADTGSVLMQRCLALQTRLDQEIWAAEKIRESYEFQSDSVALEEWTGTAREHVHMWKYQPAISSQDSKLLFTQIMDFFREMEVWSVQKASISATASQVLQLMDGQAPELRRRLTLLEQTWADLTAVLPSAHDTLQQLLAGMTQREVMSDLNVWVSHMEGRLKEEKNKFQYVQNSTELTQHLQNLKDCKAEMTIRQCCLDFLNQSVDEPGDMEDLTNRDERILLAEDQGALNLSWILLQREIDSQVCHVEQLLQDCKDRDNRLLRLRTWVSGQTERLKAFERPQSHTQLEQALKECEEVKEKVKLKSAELLELRELHLFGQVDAEHPGDQGFFTQVDATIEECTALKQQWIQFETVVRDAALQTTRISYMLEHGRRPNLSLQQSIDHLEQLEALRAESEKAGEVWTKLPDLPPDLKNKIDSGTALLLSEHLEAQRTRWKGLVHDVELGMFRAQTVLQLWQEYGGLFKDCTRHLDLLWGRCRELLNPNPTPVDTTETIQTKTEAISALQDDIDALQNSVGEVLAASKQLIGQMEPCAAALIQSETRLLSRDVMHLSQILAGKKAVLQEELGEHLNFRGSLESVEQHLNNFESNGSQSASMETLKVGLLELSAQTAELGALNELSLRLKLSNEERERLQTLNAQWVQVFSQATEKHREMYAEWLCAQSFLQKCQGWVEILDKIEHDLAKDISGNFQAVFRQLALHQRLKMEVLISQQLLDAVVSKSLCLLEAGQVEDRSALILGLAQLKERWQGTLQKVQQRGTHLEGLVRQWRLYNTGLHRLQRLLRYSDSLLPPAGLGLCSFQQLQCSIQDFQWAQEQLSLHEGLFTQTLQAGKQIFPWADVQMRSQLQGELSCLQENWEHCCRLMVQRKDLADSVIQKWNLCQTELEDSTVRMGEIKARLKQPLPEILEELQVRVMQEDEASLACWAGGLRELATMKADISQYVLAGDTALLQEQVEALHDQWEELCLKVSLRKQEIADRLNAWIIFNEKNRELCEWLAQMENKVAHSSEHLSIEDMVEKLKKDCMEEINLFSENKSHLKQLGEQLLLASDRTKQAEVHGALRDVNDRWQHLFDHIETRVKKLKETLVTVQQLDKNMSNLRTWLSRVETELTKPVLYTVCHNDEIQRRLAEQQELQWDIEQHTEGVGSVLTLCEVLLHDEDACGSDVENDSLQQTSRSLDQRWRNICAMSLERRMRIEETWRLWCKFLDDYSHFEDWLNLAERTVADPNSSDVLYTVAKEELKRFEGFQRQVHERLTQLEIINNQYRRLARENRTDTANKLKTMVQKANQRWDNLQRRVAAILRRLRHFTCQREEFEGTRESLLVWLTEMDLQLTNVEHFSETDINDKMKRLNGFKKEITRNTMKIDALIVFGESLIQRSAPLDAALIEDELEELHSYCQEVFGRVARFHQRLTSPRLVLLEEPEVYSRDQTVELKGSEPTASGQDTPPTQPSMCLLAPPQERSGRETPVSVDSIPLEWDHTGDVGGSSSHDEDEEATYYSALSDVEITENPESFVKSTSRTLGVPLVSGRVITEAQSWHSPDTPMRKSLLDMSDGERASPTRTSTPYKQGYVRLMSECSGSIESVKRVSLILEDEDQREEQGLTGLNTADTQSGVLERWELLQAQALSQEQSCSRDPQQMTSDLQDINTWLGRVTPELEKLQKPETSVSVRIMEAKVRQLKEMQKAFAHYKTLMLSLNLGSRDLQQAKNPESQELQESMRNMNRGWTEACAGLESWEDSLRLTLMRCQEFHEALHSLLLWLAHAESRCYTVNILEPAVQDHTLVEHRSMLKGLEEELQSRQRQMSSLQEIAAGLLPEAGGEGSTEAKEKLHVIRNKLRLLLRRVSQDLQTVQERLVSSCYGKNMISPSAEATVGRRTSGSTRENHESSAQRSFFYRVLRAAFPLHLLFLLLLVLACLVPLSEDDYSCTLSNNFARSFYPMLRYTNGPPPT
ncbi:nesprin-2a [Chanos chanos]|uniref:Nesprin-2a n=1 Tax=Chanos chanos TaxID=29144 RepID=A0A6J2V8B8_CHACN|nr:nesprin-2-like [Chanos chanos]